jgi:hypothetical protein
MSLATVEALKPSTQKITLVELDFGAPQTVWFNWAAGVWYVDFDAVYDLIDPALLAGVTAQTTGAIGSVSSDAAPLLAVASAAEVQTTELSFYYDSATRRVYIHLQNGDEPRLHRITLGVVYGVSTVAGTYNGMIYEARLREAPSISKSKDPLFFGRIAFEGGSIEIDNTDGAFDDLGEDNDVFGNAVRILQGFGGFDYSDFARMGSGIIEDIEIGPDSLRVSMKDARSALTRELPTDAFNQTTYPYLKDANVGKSIPVCWGVCRNVPVICTNEDETTPAAYTFKFLDTTNHEAHALTAVRVNDATVTPTASSLSAGTFSLSDTDYSPGDKVTADIEGYEDGSGNLISNALDIILDILESYFGIEYGSTSFNEGEWTVATAAAPDIGYFGDDPTEAIQIIEEICASARVWFITQDDGRYTARIYNPSRAVSQTLVRADLLEIPAVRYDPAEVLTSTRVGYNKDWSEGEFVWLHDTSQESAIFVKYKTYREESFETLLTNAPDAQAFSDDILDLSGEVNRAVPLRMKLQGLGRELGDFIVADIGRRQGAEKLAKLEIMGISRDLVRAETTLSCRIVEFLPETVYVQGGYWGEDYWGDELWCMTYEEVVA